MSTASSSPPFDEVWNLAGQLLNEDPRSDVRLVNWRGQPSILKRFRYRGIVDPLLRAIIGSHTSREARNFEFLRRIGVACPEVVHQADDRRLFGLRRAYLLTVFLEETTTLERHLQEDDLGAAERRSIATELARQVARMHELGYIDRDLKFRNILVDKALRPVHVDSPQGQVMGGRLDLRAACRDLGTLMKHAPRFCSAAEIRRFFLVYARARGLGRAERRTLARLVGARSSELHRRAGR